MNSDGFRWKTVTHKRFHLFWQILMNWKSVKRERKWVLWLASMASVASSGDLATLIPLSPPSWHLRPSPPSRESLHLMAFTDWDKFHSNDNLNSLSQRVVFLEYDLLYCSHPCSLLFLRQMRGRERREGQTRCSAVCSRHNVKLSRTLFFIVLVS